MLRRRCHRLTTTFFVVLSLLFSQLALASYICPGEADVQTMSEMMASGQPFDGMDPQQPALCHEHSTPIAKTFEALTLPVLAPPLVVQVLEFPFVLEALAGRQIPPSADGGERPPPDPLFLSTLRLRV